MKKFFVTALSYTKIVAFIAIIGFSFYSGMYVVANKYDTGETQKEKLIASIVNATKDTSSKPIIMIVPEKSLYEKAKYLVMKEPEREVIKITSDELVDALYAQNQNPSWLTTAIDGTTDVAKKAWNGTVDGAKWTYEKVKFW